MFVIKTQSQYYKQFKRDFNSKQYYDNQKRNIKYFNQSDQFSHIKNNVYQIRSQIHQNDRSSSVKVITKIKKTKESNDRNSIKSKIIANKRDRKNNYKQRGKRFFENDKQRKNKYDRKNKYCDEKFKTKVYVTQNHDFENDESFIDDCEDYH